MIVLNLNLFNLLVCLLLLRFLALCCEISDENIKSQLTPWSNLSKRQKKGNIVYYLSLCVEQKPAGVKLLST